MELKLNSGSTRVTSSFRDGGDSSLPLLVCLHGGGFNRAYFDLPRNSLLDRAQANGFAAIAVDRPGYGESDGVVAAEGWFDAQAEALDGIVAAAWERVGGGRPGVVLIGHSFGATIAMRLAARKADWPLAGLVISATLAGAPASMKEFAAGIAEAPPQAPIALDPAMVRSFFYGPDGSFDPAVLAEVESTVVPAPAVEIREWAEAWGDEAAAVAAAIEVPTQIRIAEHDALLDVSAESVGRFGSSFTAAPLTDVALIPGAGHNADHHHFGTCLHLEQLAFAARAAAR